MKKYKICDLVVKMEAKHEPLKTQLIPYLTDEREVDFEFPNLDEQTKKLFEERNFKTYGHAEYMMFGSYFYTRLLVYNGIMLHSSAVVYEDKAYLFSAPSGTGKSTHTNLWTKVFPSAYILNDDKPAIRLIDDRLYAYGTPFSGKTDLNVPERKEIKAIYFIEQAKDNWIREATIKETITYFYRETVKISDERLLESAFNLIEKAAEQITFYIMGLTISEESVKLAYNTAKQKKN